MSNTDMLSIYYLLLNIHKCSEGNKISLIEGLTANNT